MMLPWLLLGCAGPLTSPSPCSDWSAPIPHAQIASSALSEASGLAASKRNDDVLWAHNDGDDGELFALHTDGSLRARMTLDGVEVEDWEDIATGIGPDGRAWLFVGDIGDNDGTRSFISVWRVPEPEDVDTDQVLYDAQRFDFAYPDGPEDAEALLYDPVTEHVLVVTKHNDHAELYTAAFDLTDEPNTLQPTGELDFGDPAFGDESAVTAADATADGSLVALRTESKILLYRPTESDSLAATLLESPCIALAADGEVFGEGLAIAETSTESAIYTIGEGTFPWLYREVLP